MVQYPKRFYVDSVAEIYIRDRKAFAETPVAKVYTNREDGRIMARALNEAYRKRKKGKR
jgi:hypothetical protein